VCCLGVVHAPVQFMHHTLPPFHMHQSSQCELDSLEECHAFEWTTLPSGCKAIGLCWCYAYKYNPDGTIIKGKENVCLVAQGFSQQLEYYSSTYSPVAKIKGIRITLTFTMHYDLEIMSFDIKTAFLHAKLSTTIFCKQILGFPEADPSVVLWLLVALYGLCQSLYEFYMLLQKLMICLGMICCEVDHTVFMVVGPFPLVNQFQCLPMVKTFSSWSQYMLMMAWLSQTPYLSTLGLLLSC